MIKCKAPLFVLILFTSFYCKGQTVLLNYDETKADKYERGPNQKKFVQGFVKFGMVTPPDQDNAKIKFGTSVNVGFGVRKKFKVSSIYSLGWQIEIDYTDYKFKKDPALLSPTGSTIDTRRFDVYSLRLGFFNRINFDPNRGNFLGTYLDLGIDGAYAYNIKEVYKYSTGYGKAVTKIDDLDYVNAIQSEVFAKLGYSKFNLWVKYRYTDLLKSNSGKPELPRITAGFELGF
jgi:hypothetical protein